MPIQAPPRPAIDADVIADSAYAAPQSSLGGTAPPLSKVTRLTAELFGLFPIVASLDMLIHGNMFLRVFEQAEMTLPLIASPALWLAAHSPVAFLLAGVHALCIWRLIVAGRRCGALIFGGVGSLTAAMLLIGLWLPLNKLVQALDF